ncbi:MAG: glycosyl transferase, group 1 [Polaromonas sp.]|nr:glycosyl transferase, group 1 [Polaromonas sp.]
MILQSSSETEPVRNKKRLRIAVLSRMFSTTGGGAERYSISLVEQLAHKHDIHVFAQKIGHQWPSVSYHQVSSPFLKPRWINQLWFASRTWWLTRHGFDIVHSHENTWHGDVQTVHVLPVKYNLFYGQTGWRRILRYTKVLTSPRLLTYLLLEHLRYAKRIGRRWVVTSSSLGNILAISYPKCAGDISVITPGIKLPSKEVVLPSKAEARVLLGLPMVGRILLFVANDYRKKGLQTLLDALGQLQLDVFLAIVGNSSQISFFKEKAKILGLEKRIFFLGSLDDVAPAYIAADCLAHPTLEDTFAMVVLEAMAHGLPVVVSGPELCGISGLLQNEVNAVILNNPRDAPQLSQALERVLTQKELQKKLMQEGINFAVEFQWNALALRQEKLYYELAP